MAGKQSSTAPPVGVPRSNSPGSCSLMVEKTPGLAARSAAPPPSHDQRRLLDVDHSRVEHLLVHLEVVDQRKRENDAGADLLRRDLAELDLEQDVIGPLVAGNAVGVLPGARR